MSMMSRSVCYCFYLLSLCYSVYGSNIQSVYRDITPQEFNDSIRFLVLGDWGGLPLFPYRTPIESAVATRLSEAASKYQAEFVLALGDNFYFDGVKDVEDARFQETYNHVFLASQCDVNWYLLAGNHDHNGNVSAQIAYSKLMKRWNFEDFYYPLSFKIPGTSDIVEILMLDTIVLCGNSDHDFLHKQPAGPESVSFAEEQWQWLEMRLQNSKARYLIVCGHYPVYSISEHGPTTCLVDRLMPLLHKYKVTAYFSGHDHNLQHLQTSYYGHTVDYFVSGAANFIYPSREHEDDVPPGSEKFYWANLFSLGGFAYVDATPKNLTFTFIESNGKMLYTKSMPPRIG